MLLSRLNTYLWPANLAVSVPSVSGIVPRLFHSKWGVRRMARLKADVAVRAAEQAIELGKAHSELEERLAAGFFDLLKSDAAIARASGDVQAIRSTKKAATVSQDDAVRQGFQLVSAMRALIRSGAPKNKTLWKSFGVGSTLSPTVRSVSGALGTVISAANKFPSETAAVGILAADIQKAQSYATSIATADSEQESSKVTSKQATTQLNAALDRLAGNLTHLASVARLALPADVADEFDALLPGTTRKKPAPKPA